MKSRTFRLGPFIWFVLIYDDSGKLFQLQEHDIREGGIVIVPDGVTIEDHFVSQVGRRVPREHAPQVELEARHFLGTMISDYDMFDSGVIFGE